MEFEIGKTRTGIVVTLTTAIDILEVPDAFDALAIHEAFAMRELGKRGQTDDFRTALHRVNVLQQRLLVTGHLDAQMTTLGLKTYADRLRFGARLLNAAYRD